MILLRGPTSNLRAVSFAPDGTIATVDAAGEVRTHRCAVCGTVDDLLAQAEARMRSSGRTLSDAERSRYLD